MLEVKVTTDGNQKVIDLNGELDIGTVDKFKKVVDEACDGTTGIIFNMTNLSFVDSTGVGGLLNAVKMLKNNSIEVKMRHINSEVYEVFDILGLTILLGNEVFE